MATEKRLIRLNELMQFPIRIDHYDKVNGNEHFVYGVETVLEYAENLPTVDAVEVVRCKDCVRADLYSNRPCYLFCMEHHRLVEKNDFCSYGERKNNAV